jgi:hypothetical protein
MFHTMRVNRRHALHALRFGSYLVRCSAKVDSRGRRCGKLVLPILARKLVAVQLAVGARVTVKELLVLPLSRG